jgi:hypothetical protein
LGNFSLLFDIYPPLAYTIPNYYQSRSLYGHHRNFSLHPPSSEITDRGRVSGTTIGFGGRPDIGAIMVGSGGLRKVRWSISGRGKRGGVRVIYYWAVEQSRLLMLLIYPKSERDNLSHEQLQMLKKIIEAEY